METTIVYWGYIGNGGKEHENYYLGVRSISRNDWITVLIRSRHSPSMTLFVSPPQSLNPTLN